MKTILVVDDSPEILDALRAVLSPFFRVKPCKSGEVAINIARKDPPDLILLDVNMPGMSGFEVCEKLGTMPETAKVPVIFVTASGDAENESRGFAVGGVDYITKPINAASVLNRVRNHLSLVRVTALDQLARDAILMLGEAGHYNDEDTGQHIWRMAAYSRVLASHLGWSDELSQRLELAAPLHDTGKIGIPDSILKAPRKLTDEEWVIMKQHTEIGFRILSQSSNPVFQMGAEVALYHHERWDGSGYPRGLAGTAIPMSARIVAVADVFDALTTERPYKRAWTNEDALNEIERNAGSHLDPSIVKCFLSIIDEILALKHEYQE